MVNLVTNVCRQHSPTPLYFHESHSD